MGSVIGRGDRPWSTLRAWTSRWKGRTSASSTAREPLFTTVSTPEAIAASLAMAPACRRIVFETGRMAPMLYHGLAALGLAVICIESRQAYQVLKSLATHKTDRNDARGLAHLARTGFFKPTHVKSLPAHAIRALVIARKKLVGQRVMLENQIRGLAVVFGSGCRGHSAPPSSNRRCKQAKQSTVCLRPCEASSGASCRAATRRSCPSLDTSPASGDPAKPRMPRRETPVSVSYESSSLLLLARPCQAGFDGKLTDLQFGLPSALAWASLLPWLKALPFSCDGPLLGSHTDR